MARVAAVGRQTTSDLSRRARPQRLPVTEPKGNACSTASVLPVATVCVEAGAANARSKQTEANGNLKMFVLHSGRPPHPPVRGIGNEMSAQSRVAKRNNVRKHPSHCAQPMSATGVFRPSRVIPSMTRDFRNATSPDI